MSIVSFDHQAALQLEDGTASLTLVPQFGGRLMRWDVAGQPVLHWPVVLDGQLATPPWWWRLLNG